VALFVQDGLAPLEAGFRKHVPDKDETLSEGEISQRLKEVQALLYELQGRSPVPSSAEVVSHQHLHSSASFSRDDYLGVQIRFPEYHGKKFLLQYCLERSSRLDTAEAGSDLPLCFFF